VGAQLGAGSPEPVRPSPAGVPGALTDTGLVCAQRLRYVGAGGDPLDAYLAEPTASGSHPGLILIHHARGVDSHIKDVANRLAAVGYVVVAPDLFTREGGPPDVENLTELIGRLAALPDRRVVEDLDGAAAILRGRHDHIGRLGCIGFCMGGRYSLLYACTTSGLDAAVDCWGGFVDRATPDEVTTPNRPTPPLELVPKLGCPLLAAFGAEDDNPSPQVAERLRALAAKVPHEVQIDIYPGAGHAFFNDTIPAFRPQAADDLWARVVGFFDRHLGGLNDSGSSS